MGLFDFFKPGKDPAEDMSISLTAAVDRVQQLVRIANESLEIAHKSTDLGTRRSRVGLAKTNLAEVMEIVSQYPEIQITSLSDFEKSIEDVEHETETLRAEASASERAADDFLTGRPSSLSGWEIDPVLSELHSSAVPKGVFWADYIKTLRDDPEGRLVVARDYLPLPAAFREAAVALRALIRGKRKEGLDPTDLLEDLYRLAVQESFFFAVKFIPDIGPSFNIASELPREVWQNLECPYREVGCDQLELLNKTDKKWIEEAWGEPTRHITAQAYHHEPWESAVESYRRKKKDRDEETRNFYRDLGSL